MLMNSGDLVMQPAAPGTKRPLNVAPPVATAKYFVPNFRFARVLKAAGEAPKFNLTASQARLVGERLFGPEGPSRRAYDARRPKELALAGASFLGPGDDKGEFHEDDGHVEYHHVPIVTFQRYALNIGKFRWHFREAITVCSENAQSKLWQHAVLDAIDGTSTKERGVLPGELGEAREAFDRFRVEAFRGLQDFYKEVLTKHIGTLGFDQLPDLSGLRCSAATEIVGLMAAEKSLERILERVRSIGVQAASSMHELEGSESLRAFVEWFDSKSPEKSRTPLLLRLPEEGLMTSLSNALVLSRDDGLKPDPLQGDNQIRCHFAAVLASNGEIDRYVVPDSSDDKPRRAKKYPLSQVASAFLAKEYGRRF